MFTLSEADAFGMLPGERLKNYPPVVREFGVCGGSILLARNN